MTKAIHIADLVNKSVVHRNSRSPKYLFGIFGIPDEDKFAVLFDQKNLFLCHQALFSIAFCYSMQPASDAKFYGKMEVYNLLRSRGAKPAV